MIPSKQPYGPRAWIWTSVGLVTVVSLVVSGALAFARLRLEPGTAVPFLFAVLVLGVYAGGVLYSLRVLRNYDKEAAALPECADALRELAKRIQATPSLEEANWPLVSEIEAVSKRYAGQPLLARRVSQVLQAVQRGAPLLTQDPAHVEERHFPGPERVLRAMMDVVLNLGIAGTFLSLILTFSGRTGSALSADTLLEHIGPGLVSGLIAVVVNVAIRLCHGALLSRQDYLAEQVEFLVTRQLVQNLPRQVTSPEERLTLAVGTYLCQQTENLRTLLGQQLLEPVRALQQQTAALVGHTASLARDSATWAGVSQDLKLAHTAFLDAQAAAQRRHVEQIDELFAAARKSQEESEARLAERLTNIQEASVAFVREMLRGQDEAIRAQMESLGKATGALVEAALQQFGGAVETRVSSIEAHVSQALEALRGTLPAAMETSMAAAMREAVEQVQLAAGRAGELFHAVNQTRQSADRHQASLDEWFERTRAWQEQLERSLGNSDEAQRQLLTQWHERSETALSRLQAALGEAGELARGGNEGVKAAVAQLGAEVDALQATLAGVRTPMIELRQPVVELQEQVLALTSGTSELHGALTSSVGPLSRLNEAVLGLDVSTGQLQKAIQDLGGDGTVLSEGLDASVRAMNAALEQLRATADETRRLAEEHARLEGVRADRMRTQATDTEAALRQMDAAATRMHSTLDRADALLREMLARQQATSGHVPNGAGTSHSTAGVSRETSSQNEV